MVAKKKEERERENIATTVKFLNDVMRWSNVTRISYIPERGEGLYSSMTNGGSENNVRGLV